MRVAHDTPDPEDFPIDDRWIVHPDDLPLSGEETPSGLPLAVDDHTAPGDDGPPRGVASVTLRGAVRDGQERALSTTSFHPEGGESERWAASADCTVFGDRPEARRGGRRPTAGGPFLEYCEAFGVATTPLLLFDPTGRPRYFVWQGDGLVVVTGADPRTGVLATDARPRQGRYGSKIAVDGRADLARPFAEWFRRSDRAAVDTDGGWTFGRRGFI